jgi:hypothetical protein
MPKGVRWGKAESRDGERPLHWGITANLSKKSCYNIRKAIAIIHETNHVRL